MEEVTELQELQELQLGGITVQVGSNDAALVVYTTNELRNADIIINDNGRNIVTTVLSDMLMVRS